MRILVTAGPTREFFDSVRFISNPSSGRMGYALAAEAHRRHHPVTLVSGPVEITPPAGVDVVRVVSAAEMLKASLTAFHTCAAAIMTAAVCDYRPQRRLDRKLRKRARPRPITLVPTADIAACLGRIKADRVLIGFAMEDREHHRHAERKLRAKRCDAIVLNTPANIGGRTAEVEILTAGGTWQGPTRGSKARIASIVIDLVEKLVADRRAPRRG